MHDNNSLQLDDMIIDNIRKRVSEFKQLPYLFDSYIRFLKICIT